MCRPPQTLPLYLLYLMHCAVRRATLSCTYGAGVHQHRRRCCCRRTRRTAEDSAGYCSPGTEAQAVCHVMCSVMCHICTLCVCVAGSTTSPAPHQIPHQLCPQLCPPLFLMMLHPHQPTPLMMLLHPTPRAAMMMLCSLLCKAWGLHLQGRRQNLRAWTLMMVGASLPFSALVLQQCWAGPG